MHLTPTILEAAYEFLRVTPPFSRWRLPHADEIQLNVIAALDIEGHHVHCRGQSNAISVSKRWIRHSHTLLLVMGHEMIHLKQALHKTESPRAEHNTEFKRLAKLVCSLHGWNLKEFL